MFFTICAIFWNMCKMYFFFFSIQNIRSNSYIIFLKLFPAIFFWWVIYSFPVYLFMKGLIFLIFCRSFLSSSWFNATVTAYWKHSPSFLLAGIIVAFFYSIRRIYILSTKFPIYFMTFLIQQLNIIEDKLTIFYQFQKFLDIFFWVIQKVLL